MSWFPGVWPGVHDSAPAGLPALRACRVLVLALGPGEQWAGEPQVQRRRRQQCRAPVVAAGPEDPRQYQQPDRHRDPYPGNRLRVAPGTRACEDPCAVGRVVRCCHLPHLPSTLCGKPSLLCRVKSSPGGVTVDPATSGSTGSGGWIVWHWSGGRRIELDVDVLEALAALGLGLPGIGA